MDLQSITALRKYLNISKHEPGQISIKFSLALLSDQNAMKTIKENKTTPKAILKSDLNLFSRTLTVKYDSAVIDPNDLTEILTPRDRKTFDALAEKYQTILSA